MLIIGLVFNGFGSGIAGVALIAVPELISNKWRHAGVVIADSVVYIFIVIGPIVGRYSILHGGESWRYLYWAGFAAEVVTTIGLAVFYCECCWLPPFVHELMKNSLSSSQAPTWSSLERSA